MRMSVRRLTRLTNPFSKKLANHCHMLALYFVKRVGLFILVAGPGT